MSDDIKLDLMGDSTSVKKTKAKPSLGEKLYADRLAKGLHPEISLDHETVTEGVKLALDEMPLPDVLSAREEVAQVLLPQSFLSGGSNRDLINQILGQIQATQAISQLSQTFGVSKLAYVKETKAYKALKGMTPNGLELSGTWEEFCSLLGISDEKANTDIANLRAFGEEALESMTRMGIGYRDLAQYRKLPADEKTALIEAAKAGDKDQLLDLAETLIERHIKEKTDLTAKVDDLEQDLKDTGKRMNHMNAEIERSELELSRLKGKQRLTKFEEYTEAVRDECMHLQSGCELNLNSLHKLFNDVFYAEPTPESQLRIEQVYVAMSVAASRAYAMLEEVRELIPDFAPERIQGQHILTPEEAERWLLDGQMLANKHKAEILAREVKRENSKEGKRGRKIGSKNKVEE